jgi:hypothetical protein
MQDFFANIYLWFESLFGQNLSEYLWGYNCATQDYTNANIFSQMSLIMLGSSLAIAVLYYYVINHPRFNMWMHWLIMLAINAAINLFAGWGRVYTEYVNGNIGDCLVYARDEEGSVISYLINPADCWGFGAASAILSAGVFTVFSFIIKWWSSNCKHSPCL